MYAIKYRTQENGPWFGPNPYLYIYIRKEIFRNVRTIEPQI